MIGGQLGTFALTALVIIAVPGPSVMFIVARALAHGRVAAVLTVAGNTVGEYIQVVAVALGIGAVAQRSVAVLSVLKFIGAAYLIYLGVRAIRGRGSLQLQVDSAPSLSKRRYFLEGVVVGVTNPKTIVFLAVILPLFVNRAAGSVPVQILLLGAVFSAIALATDTLWALVAGTVRSWFARSPKRLEMVGASGGVAMVAIGAGLALTGNRD